MSLKIAVIGAGLAGLTAAYRLYQKGHDVEIFEARSRVGGRVFTVLMKNSEGTYSTVEIGGQNITDGGEAVCLLKLAQELDLSITEKEILLSLLVCQNDQCKDFNALLSEYEFLINNTDIDALAKNCVSMAELLDKLFPEDNSLKLAIQTRLAAYEGLDVRNQSIYHNIDTLKSILKGGISPAHALKKIVFKEIQGGNAKLPLKIAEILENQFYLNKILIQVLRDKDQIKLIFADNTSALCDK
jgi:monoamine oxidase